MTPAPATSAAPPAPQGPPAPQAALTRSGDDTDRPGAGVPAAGDGAALRAIGALFACHSGALDALDAAGRARCEAMRLAQAKSAPQVDGVPAEKRAYYDAVVAKVEAARGLAAAPPHVPPLSRSHGLDIGASYRCDIRFGPGAAAANRKAGVRRAIPPCPLRLPFNRLTAESLAAPPDTLREREADARAAARLDPPATDASPSEPQ